MAKEEKTLQEIEWELGHESGRVYTPNDVKKALDVAIHYMKVASYYAPLIERYPVMVDDGMPKRTMNLLKEHEAPACADDNNVYLSTEIFADLLNESIAEFYKGNQYDISPNIVDNLITVLAHEYTHVLCQHVRIGREFEKKTKMEQTCHLLACEIEANRGHMVKYNASNHYASKNLLYDVAVTEEKYPETRNDKYYPQIYATLLRMYKERKQEMDAFAQAIKDMLTSMEADGQKNAVNNIKGNKKGTKNENKNKAQNKSQGNNNKSNMDGVNSTISSVNRQQNEDDDENDYDVEWDELTEEQIEESIKNATKVVNNVEKEVSGKGSEAGYGLETPYVQYKPELTPQEMLETNYERWHEKDVKNELKKLKGLIKGTISKNRESTYARPTRRPISGSSTLIKKGVRYEKSYNPKVLIAMDSSGSMCSTTMKEVACAIENIFKDLGKPKVGSYICKHESNVSDVKPMSKWKDVVDTYRPCGGNCFLHVVEEANKLGVDVVLNIGDGQDTITRGEYGVKAIEKFKNDNRVWYDVLVTNKNGNKYYYEEKFYDEKRGFHREGIFLGNDIKKYFD